MLIFQKILYTKTQQFGQLYKLSNLMTLHINGNYGQNMQQTWGIYSPLTNMFVTFYIYFFTFFTIITFLI
jgi:hypothetical protein